MALAMEQLGPTGPHMDALREQARQYGQDLAASGPAGLRERLSDVGYDLVEEPDGTLQMRNCPFHTVVQTAQTVTCTMNLELVKGLNEENAAAFEPVLRPAEGRCCVVLRPSRPGG